MANENEKRKPVKKFKAGAVESSIWNNKGKREDGTEYDMRSATIERRYKDKDDKWQGTSSFRMNDLPKLALCATKTYEFIAMHSDEDDDAEVKDAGDVE